MRAVIAIVSVVSAVIPVAAVFSRMEWYGWSVGVAALAAFLVMLTPYAPVLITARYQPGGRGKMFGLLVCVLLFGLVPAAGFALFTTAGGGGLGFALLFLLGGTVLLVTQLVVFAIAARLARGKETLHPKPAFLRWV